MAAKPAITTLTIGLPICNEEKTLLQFMRALEKAVDRLPPYVRVETIACVNGCTDHSEDMVRQLSHHQLGRKLNLSVCTSDKGKLKAEVKIAQSRTYDGPLCFLDTDTLPDDNVLSALLRHLESNRKCHACFARVEPAYDPTPPGDDAHFRDALRSYYACRDYFPPKRYIHGRAFMLRDGKEFENLYADIPQRVARTDPQLAADLRLTAGPLVDDIYLSFAIAHKYGPDSIGEAKGAKIRFHPPTNEKDFYAAIQRTETEIKRLSLLYPETQYLDGQFRTQEVPPEHLKTRLPTEMTQKVTYIKELEENCRIRARKELVTSAAQNPLLDSDRLWITAGSTKKKFTRAVAPMEVLPANASFPAEKITGVLVIAFTQDGKVVVVKNARGWDVPGGHIEPGDKNYLMTARRETREEANITLRRLTLCNVIKFPGTMPELDGYMPVLAGYVDRMGKFTPSGEISGRDTLFPEDFLKKYTAASKQDMAFMLTSAAQALMDPPVTRQNARSSKAGAVAR